MITDLTLSLTPADKAGTERCSSLGGTGGRLGDVRVFNFALPRPIGTQSAPMNRVLDPNACGFLLDEPPNDPLPVSGIRFSGRSCGYLL